MATVLFDLIIVNVFDRSVCHLPPAITTAYYYVLFCIKYVTLSTRSTAVTWQRHLRARTLACNDATFGTVTALLRHHL